MVVNRVLEYLIAGASLVPAWHSQFSRERRAAHGGRCLCLRGSLLTYPDALQGLPNSRRGSSPLQLVLFELDLK